MAKFQNDPLPDVAMKPPGPANPIQELMALHAMGRFAEMEARARAAIKTASSSAILHEMLGIALCAQRRFEEALGSLRKAVVRQPQDAQFHENLALCQRQLKQYEAAAESLRKSLQLRPASVEALAALGSVLRSLRRTEEAEVVLRQALARARKSLADALSSYSTMRQVCAWEITADADTQCRGRRFLQGELDAISPFTSTMMATMTASQQLQVARNYSQRFGRPAALSTAQPGSARDRIRVGYLSGDLREHAFSRLTLPAF